MNRVKYLDDTSRKLIKMLRHDPTPLNMGKDGRILVDDVLSHFNITISELMDIVEFNNKQRFSMDAGYIWANQGHSINVDVSLETVTDTDLLIFHGTSKKAFENIMKQGLSRMKRNHVHWTKNLELAEKRASQQGGKDCVIITLDYRFYRSHGNKVFKSANDVYLTDDVDPKYLKQYK